MIRNDILEFLKSQKIFKEIIFISTKIKKIKLKKFQNKSKIIKEEILVMIIIPTKKVGNI